MATKTAERITDRWLKSKVKLAAKEKVLERGYFWHRVSGPYSEQGRLYLTGTRLIWVRAALNLPLGPATLEIALGDIQRFEKRRSAAILWRHELVLTTDSGERCFVPFQLVENVDTWLEAIAGAVGGDKSA